jgi:hypothetical protein
MTEEAQSRIYDIQYNVVTVGEAIGTIFLGILSLVLLVAFLRAQARNQKLLSELHQEAHNE